MNHEFNPLIGVLDRAEVVMTPVLRSKSRGASALPIAVSSVIDLLPGLIRPGASNFARE